MTKTTKFQSNIPKAMQELDKFENIEFYHTVMQRKGNDLAIEYESKTDGSIDYISHNSARWLVNCYACGKYRIGHYFTPTFVESGKNYWYVQKKGEEETHPLYLLCIGDRLLADQNQKLILIYAGHDPIFVKAVMENDRSENEPQLICDGRFFYNDMAKKLWASYIEDWRLVVEEYCPEEGITSKEVKSILEDFDYHKGICLRNNNELENEIIRNFI